MDILVTAGAPALVAVLTAAAAVIGLQYRDVDAYARRRAVWQWLLVALAAAATWAATGSAGGVGSLVEIVAMATLGCAAVLLAHLMWRRRVPDAEPQIRNLATAAAAGAVLVLLAATMFAYSHKGCRQAEPLVQSSLATWSALMPAMDAGQGPTVGDYTEWARLIREQADQVTDAPVAEQAHRLGELAGQIADAVRSNAKADHAVLGAQYSEQFNAIASTCRIQVTS